MKKLTLLLASVFGIAMQSLAHGYGHAPINSYADAFVFDEMGVTFSVYPDGEFDFYMDGLNHSTTMSNGFVDVTFNSGYNYNPYVQYDDFGAVIQVENVPIYYDYYGRVNQIGDVMINYRNRRVCQVGGLRVFYNRRGYYAYHTGFINVWNPYFVYRPFYVAFARPAVNLCFVRPTPYRQYYRPVRYTYYRPYVTNVRPCYATIGTVYRPRSGYGQVHARYTQAPRRNERPVMRERRKITTATVASQQVMNTRSRSTSRSNSNGYSRNMNAAKPASTRSNSRSVHQTNTRSSKPTSTNIRTNNRAVQTSPRSTSGSRSVSSRSTSNSKPTSTVNRSVKPSSGSRSVQSRGSSSSSRSGAVRPSSSTRSSSSGSRAVKPSSSTRSTAQKPTTTRRSSSSGTRTVKPTSSSRSTASKPRSSSRPSSSVSKGSSRSSASKGRSSSSKSGGKVSVGNRSSKRGR